MNGAGYWTHRPIVELRSPFGNFINNSKTIQFTTMETTMPMEPQTMSGRILKRMLMESLEENRNRKYETPTVFPPKELPEKPEPTGIPCHIARAGLGRPWCLHWNGGKPAGIAGVSVRGRPVSETIISDRR